MGAAELDQLSKGTCQKAAVAQALLADPRLLVLDDAVRERVAAGGTVFSVDHDPGRLAALTNPPLVRGGGWSTPVTAVGAGAVLLVSGSPAKAAVTGLVTGSRTGTVHYPVLAPAAAAVLAAAAGWVSARCVSPAGPAGS